MASEYQSANPIGNSASIFLPPSEMLIPIPTTIWLLFPLETDSPNIPQTFPNLQALIGFKSLGNNLNTGFDINEITSKIRYKTPNHIKEKQSFEFKFHHYDEISNETYLGLTESDFEKTPHLRYAASEKDKMDAEHIQYLFKHEINFSERFTMNDQVSPQYHVLRISAL